MIKLEYHNLSNLFPLLEGEEFEALKKDIQTNGLLTPIWLDREGKIVDGRNRYRACIETNTKLEYKTWEGNDLLRFIISMNLKRRHLNETQRAIIANKIANMKSGERTDLQPSADLPKVSQTEAAKLMNIGIRTVRKVKKIIEYGDEQLVKSIEEGNLSADKATKEIKKRKKIEERKKISASGEKIELKDIILLGDMLEVSKTIKDNSIDLIITDPPYSKDYLYLWDNLAELAERLLKPSKFLIVYSGQLYLPDVIKKLSNKLQYYWMICLKLAGSSQLMYSRNIFCKWKPILVYQKAPLKGNEIPFVDVIDGSGREKNLHDWQQGEDELDYIIQKFTSPGDIILDPLCGSGTTLIATIKNKRIPLGIELDEQNFNIAKERISKFHISL